METRPGRIGDSMDFNKTCAVIMKGDINAEEFQRRKMDAPSNYASVCLPDGSYRQIELFNDEIAYFWRMPRCKAVLELGTSFGGTTAILSLVGESVVTIDLFDPNRLEYTLYKERWETNNVQTVLDGLKQFSNIIPIIGDTKKVVPLLKDEFFDFVFIDADHTYQGVKTDTENVYPKLKSTGKIMFHDAYFSPVIMDWFSEKLRQEAKLYEGINRYIHEIADGKYIDFVGVSAIIRKEHIHL